MKQKKTWRYFCDYCGRSGCSKFHMRKHEAACTKNPGRNCRFCVLLGEDQAPITELLRHIPDYMASSTSKHQEFEVPQSLRELAGGCPACILATLRQSGGFGWVNFNYKEEAEEAMKLVNERRSEDLGFCSSK